MTTTTFTEDEILHQLDECTSEFVFPMLDNGHVYPITQRLNVYGDSSRWAIIIEAVGYSVRGGDHNGMRNCLHVYGNCLDREPGLRDEDMLSVTSDGPEGPTFDDWYMVPAAKTITIRGEVVPFKLSKSLLDSQEIEMVEDELTATDLFRSLLPVQREKFLATEDELRLRIPSDLPQLLKLDDWYHPDVVAEELPSENETFQLIAKVVTAGDATLFKPTNQSNTHWKNWPEGGTL